MDKLHPEVVDTGAGLGLRYPCGCAYLLQAAERSCLPLGERVMVCPSHQTAPLNLLPLQPARELGPPCGSFAQHPVCVMLCLHCLNHVDAHRRPYVVLEAHVDYISAAEMRLRLAEELPPPPPENTKIRRGVG